MDEKGGEYNEAEQLEEFALPVLQGARSERIHELGAKDGEGFPTMLQRLLEFMLVLEVELADPGYEE